MGNRRIQLSDPALRALIRPTLCVFAALLLGACATIAQPPPRGSWSFAVFGDTPYNQTAEALLTPVIDQINREDLAFVVHVGDIKSGGEPCSDELFERRKRLLARIRHPLIVLPGDNEWTDCRRPRAGGHDPLERLEALRRLFHAGDTSLGERPMRLERQSDLDARHPEYREHVRWSAKGIVFAGVNVPGHNNNIAVEAEYRRRTAAVLDWLDEAAALAARPEAGALVIAMQANPFFWNRFPRLPGTPDGLAALREKLLQIVTRLGKPVLLVHGDTHSYTVDHPLADPQTGVPMERFIRLEVFGSPTVNWIRVTPLAGGAGGFWIQPARPESP